MSWKKTHIPCQCISFNIDLSNDLSRIPNTSSTKECHHANSSLTNFPNISMAEAEGERLSTYAGWFTADSLPCLRSGPLRLRPRSFCLLLVSSPQRLVRPWPHPWPLSEILLLYTPACFWYLFPVLHCCRIVEGNSHFSSPTLCAYWPDHRRSHNRRPRIVHGLSQPETAYKSKMKLVVISMGVHPSYHPSS